MNNRALVTLVAKPELPAPCDICGGDCKGQPPSDYQVIPPPLSAKVAHMPVAPYRIIDPELQRVIYSPGQSMTREDAIKYGIPLDEEKYKTTDEATERVRKIVRRSRKPQQDRAVKPAEDRSAEAEAPNDEKVVEAQEAKEESATEDTEQVAEEPKRRGRPRKTVGG